MEVNLQGLNECIKALEAIASSVGTLVANNEERTAFIENLLENTKVMAEEIHGIQTLVDNAKKISSDLHMLSINTAIEAARTQMPAVSVIATEMRKMSNDNASHGNNAIKLASDVQEKVEWILQAITSSFSSIASTSGELEAISASVEELIAVMEELRREA